MSRFLHKQPQFETTPIHIYSPLKHFARSWRCNTSTEGNISPALRWFGRWHCQGWLYIVLLPYKKVIFLVFFWGCVEKSDWSCWKSFSSGWSTPWFRHRGVSLRLDARVQGGVLFEKPRNSPVAQKEASKAEENISLRYCLWTIGWSGVGVISNLVGWAKYCLASLSSSRLPTLRRVQHLISVFNNIDFRLQNGPICESI